ncbi:DUF421 domain-containing protein [Solimonas fluminis]|uniref:DUF421 domain-containing protein n=1 Tax=Solimonas fluminis TaxID=2086571 RepID=A0A2S5TI29_9GAMM|nr:YetF domain-containing protein [Solimonas fluminis]PPE74625.1 DUF421 domain-containing protein [Solimonas fluminis]
MFEALLQTDLRGMFLPDVSLLEIFLRGTLIYLGLFVLLRWFRRPTGQLGIADVLLITLLADASQNAMSGPYESVSSGIGLVLTIMFWDQVIDRLSYRWPRLAHWTQPPPVELIADGVVHEENLERHHISRDELRCHLRQHGVDDFAAVHRCFLENTGHISVLKRDGGDT